MSTVPSATDSLKDCASGDAPAQWLSLLLYNIITTFPSYPTSFVQVSIRKRSNTSLIDLQLLGISNLLLLRGDKAREDHMFKPTAGGYAHTTELIGQVNRFNEGFFIDGSPIKHPEPKFHYGVAAYPEKHEEAPNLEMDMKYLKQKQDLGAEYAVTQLFYDNSKFFSLC